MIYLKEANLEDVQKEFEFITQLPEDENGFTNPNCGCSFEEFTEKILPGYIDHSKGLNLPAGHVPGTQYFLWDEDEIVGLFRIRHHLCEALANGAGHIGYGIRKEFRGRGYANEGLRLTIEKAWSIIPEDEIYMSVHKDNPASLKTQLKNGAYIHHEDEKEYFTRVKRPKYIALTFDDGPSDTTTRQVLSKLKKHGVVGSFFLIGQNMTPEREEILREEIAMGCDLQNHSLTHSDMREMSEETIKAEIEETTGRIVSLTGKEPEFFRPPYIYVSDRMFDSIPLIFICGIASDDWIPDTDAAHRARKVIEGARNGAVVLLHDLEGNDATVEALDIIIPELKKQGYQFVTITELFQRAGITAENAKREVYTYTDQ